MDDRDERATPRGVRPDGEPDRTASPLSLKHSPRFNSGLVFGLVSMVGSVVLLAKTLQQTLAQMTADNPRVGGQQMLQVVVSTPPPPPPPPPHRCQVTTPEFINALESSLGVCSIQMRGGGERKCPQL